LALKKYSHSTARQPLAGYWSQINIHHSHKEKAMIKKLPESEGAIIGIEVSGKIDSMEENKWIEIFDKLIAEQGRINILVLLNAKFSVGVDVAYDDLKWTFKNLKNMNKLAIVSQSTVLAWLVAADSPFGKLAGISEKHFDTSHLQDAWRWVKE
jgi:hypothetical protein